MEQSFTEGARRVLELAGRLALEGRAPQVSPAHLLWALALDESRASEMLEQHGIRLETLQAECPLFSANAFDETEPPETAAAPPHSETLRDVLHAARQLVAAAGRQVEIGTESLLYGLAEAANEVAGVLRRYGLGAQRAADQATSVAGLQNHPIDIDFAIAWKDRTQDEQTDTLRILDAAANRAREGLRVVEDYLRFSRDHAGLTELTKQCRHDLTAAFGPLNPLLMIAARETQRDVGTRLHTRSERARSSANDVLQANLKRTQEAGRTLEEFSKLLSPEVSDAIKAWRYRLYTLEKAILQTEAARRRLEGRNLYLLLTEELCHHGSGPAVRDAVANGVGIVQIREKSWSDRKLLEHARRIRDWTREAGALLIMNDRPDLAVLADADGVHVGQDELPVREVRRIVGPERLIGVSTHTIEQARQAVLDGADYLGVGPVFPSGTKSFSQFSGLEFVRAAAAEIALPWFAIGGIGAENVAEVRAAGARRIAVSGAICRSEHPGAAAAELKAALAAPGDAGTDSE